MPRRTFRYDQGTDIDGTQSPVAVALEDESLCVHVTGGTQPDSLESSIDAFGRSRMSQPQTIFDAKQLFNNLPQFFDDQETAGTGTSSTYNANKASSTLSVGTSLGTRVRQTFQRFNYQPGKSQLINATGILYPPTTGIVRRIGYFDEKNGLFFESNGTTVGVTVRGYMTGSAVDNTIAQADWNIDPLDGTGASGVTIDWSYTQIFVIDFEWLGVGTVRWGIVNQGRTIYCHKLDHANLMGSVYMSTPNLPIRYEISNDGTGVASDLEQICSTVISEGGLTETGFLRHIDSNTLATLSSGQAYCVLGIRLQSGYIGLTTLLESVSLVLGTKQDRAHWELYFNPQVNGTIFWEDIPDSGLQYHLGALGNTQVFNDGLPTGIAMDGGFFTDTIPATRKTNNALKLGSAIDGTLDTIYLVVTPITNNIEIDAAINWRELL